LAENDIKGRFQLAGGSAFFNLASKEETIKVIKLLNNLPEASKKLFQGSPQEKAR
jgi:hypothetical protein